MEEVLEIATTDTCFLLVAACSFFDFVGSNRTYWMVYIRKLNILLRLVKGIPQYSYSYSQILRSLTYVKNMLYPAISLHPNVNALNNA